MVSEAVEKIADTVGKVGDEADQVAEAVPEGGLNQIANFVEDLAEETTKDVQKVEDLMNKVHFYLILLLINLHIEVYFPKKIVPLMHNYYKSWQTIMCGESQLRIVEKRSLPILKCIYF